MNLLPLFSLFTLTSATSFPLERSLNPPSKASSSEYRLPLVAYPVHYDLTVEPNFTNFSFKGETSINLKIVEETDNITLHANNLTITTEGVRFGNAEGNIKVIDLVYTSRTQFLTIVLEREVTKGYYVLNISYEGYLDNNNKGFYRASYEDSAGETRYGIVRNRNSLCIVLLIFIYSLSCLDGLLQHTLNLHMLEMPSLVSTNQL